MKTETGVMVIKDGKGWGKIYKKGNGISYGWVPLEDAIIANPELCKNSTDIKPIGMLSKSGQQQLKLRLRAKHEPILRLFALYALLLRQKRTVRKVHVTLW